MTSLRDAIGAMPDLRDGNCQPGRSPLPPAAWDGTGTPMQLEAARVLCQSCPVLGRCQAWLMALPRRERPVGIVAGKRLVPTFKGLGPAFRDNDAPAVPRGNGRTCCRCKERFTPEAGDRRRACDACQAPADGRRRALRAAARAGPVLAVMAGTAMATASAGDPGMVTGSQELLPSCRYPGRCIPGRCIRLHQPCGKAGTPSAA